MADPGAGFEEPKPEDPLVAEDLHNFWGQLWYIPNHHPKPPNSARSRARVKEGETLVWIRRDLWKAKSFEPSDCHPIGEGDVWAEAPLKLNFAEFFWGDKQKRSFAEVVKAEMAGHGRGRGPRRPKEDWDGWSGNNWNQFHQPPPMPYFNQPPPPYGYYPPPPAPHPPPMPPQQFNRSLQKGLNRRRFSQKVALTKVMMMKLRKKMRN